MNWKNFIFKVILMVVMCIAIDVINIGVGQMTVNYMATYQMSNTVDSTFWIQIVPILRNIGTILMFVIFFFVFKKEIKYIWDYWKSKKNKENEENKENEKV